MILIENFGVQKQVNALVLLKLKKEANVTNTICLNNVTKAQEIE